MTNRTVTIEDFIKDEFKGKDPNDYEFRGDGKIVRKDRWEAGIRHIHCEFIESGYMSCETEFEIEEVLKAVDGLLGLYNMMCDLPLSEASVSKIKVELDKKALANVFPKFRDAQYHG